MLLISPANVQATEFRRQDLLAETARLRLVANSAHHAAAPRRWTPAVLAPIRFIATALGRLGELAHDSRETLRSKEQDLAALGVTWGSDPAGDRQLAAELRAGIARRAAAAPRYPTIAAIDRARDDARPRFAAAANAGDLACRARELTDWHWSESAWLTGQVPRAAFERVCAALEAERIAAETATPLVTAGLAGEPVAPAAA